MKPPPAEESNARTLTLGVVFFLSGMVALIYEAAWQRQFTLLFGSAAPATAAVLAAYFAGLGLGSWLLGEWGARWSRPLRTYAMLELVIAAGALTVAPLLSLYARFYPEIYPLGERAPALLVAVKCGLAFLAIVAPAAAMGGTLPVLAQLFENRRDHLGEHAGRLYMLNTAGAALGVLLFPLMLRAFGMRHSTLLCAVINAALAATAFGLARSAVPEEPVRTSKKSKPAAAVGLRRWLTLAFLSGFVTFVLQVGWSRLFAQTHGNSVYSFSLIVAVFIAAIAAGAQLARVLLRKKWTPEKALGTVWLRGGILTLISAVCFLAFTGGLKYTAPAAGFPWGLLALAMTVIFIPVVPLAAGLPLILQKTASLTPRAAGALTGTVLAWNVAGSVAGALAAGFVFPFTLGLWGTVCLAGTAAIVCAMVAAPKAKVYGIPAVVLGVTGVVLGVLDVWPRVRVAKSNGEQLLALKEGAYGVVAVVEVPGSRKLKLNNHYGLGGSYSAGDERMQVHIPLLLQREAWCRCAFLGFGTGISAGGAYYHQPNPREEGDKSFRVTALELVPEAAELAERFFAEENNHFTRQPWARVVTEDARNFLRGTPEVFHVIVGDLVVPWRQGEGALYTLEHFQAARARLTPGGLYCAWLPLFQMGEEDFHCILRTFLEVFPDITAWRGDFSPDEPALALIGFADGSSGLQAFTERRKAMKEDPLNPHLARPAGAWMHYIGTVTREQAGNHPLNTEDAPRVELRTSRPPPFTGRRFQAWENEIRQASAGQELPPEAQAGREAGTLMGEFGLLLSERRKNEAAEVQQEIVRVLGPEAAGAVFKGGAETK